MGAPGSKPHWLPKPHRRVRSALGATRVLAGAFLLAALGAVGACQREAAPAVRARGDAGLLLSTLPAATALVEARVERVARIDRHGYRASARVQRSLKGPFEPGTPLEIAWEELAVERAPRFASGETVVVALTPLPTTSLWFHRFPPQLRSERTLAVAGGGDAFAADLSADDLERLGEFARLAADQPYSLSAAIALLRFWDSRNEQLARAALALLDQDWSEPIASAPAFIEACAQALARPKPLWLGSAILEWAARRQVRGLIPVLDRIARAHTPLAPHAILAARRLGHPLPEELLEPWLSHPDGAVRASATRALDGPNAAARLARLAGDDPDPTARAAALTRLRELAGNEAFPTLAAGLTDPEASVRLAAAQQLSVLGETVRQHLEEFALAQSGDAALAAVAAFEGMGAAGHPALVRLAKEHPDPRVRALAEIAARKSQGEHGSKP